jgi:hypothetical protein
MSVEEFVAAAAVDVSDETLAPVRVVPTDPWERRGSSTATEHRLAR